MSCGKCYVISLYCVRCSGNVSVCFVYCVFDSVCELLSVMEVFSVCGGALLDIPWCWCGVQGGVVVVGMYMGGIRGSGVFSSGVCVMCMCLDWDGVRGVGDEWVRRLCLGFTNPGGTWGKWDVCLCFGCGGVGGVEGSGWAFWDRVWEGGMVLCLCALWVCVLCVDGRSKYMYSVLSGYLRILGAVFNHVAPYRYLLPNLYLSVADIANPDLFV